MKRHALYLTFTVLGVLAFSSLMNVARASGISVGTYDAQTSVARDTFARLEDVKIIAHSSNKPLTIKIFDPYNAEVYSKIVESYDFDEIISDVTTESGEYTVEASSPGLTPTRRNFAIVFFNVVPEAQFGTASIAIVCLGALGGYGFLRRRKTKSF